LRRIDLTINYALFSERKHRGGRTGASLYLLTLTATAGLEELVKVTYVQPDGERRTLELEVGSSVMQGAIAEGLNGIDADCGGACACATCHVKVDAAWSALVGPPNAIEAEMLDTATNVDERSRLSCQIQLTPELDGLVVCLPSAQR
jgi:2Fe-2S ferredoxin